MVAAVLETDAVQVVPDESRLGNGVIAMAPHVFIEPLCLTSIANAAHAFEHTDLAQKLGRYHGDARRTFYGWADVWLDKDFTSWDIRDDYLPNVTTPVLVLQGYDDVYGTMLMIFVI